MSFSISGTLMKCKRNFIQDNASENVD